MAAALRSFLSEPTAMSPVNSEELDRLLLAGVRLEVLRNALNEVVRCRLTGGREVHLGLFRIYEKAGLVAPVSDCLFEISLIGRARIPKAYAKDARFRRRNRLADRSALPAYSRRR
jgi:hypothetical protein